MGQCARASVLPHPPSETRPSMPPDRTEAVVALSALSPQGLKPGLQALQVLCSGLSLLTLSPVLGAIVGVHASKCQRGRGRWTLGMKEPTEFLTPQNHDRALPNRRCKASLSATAGLRPTVGYTCIFTVKFVSSLSLLPASQ